MLCTEAEASLKWCPMVKRVLFVGKDPSLINPSQEAEAETSRCIASGCMMWRLGVPLRVEVGRRKAELGPIPLGWRSVIDQSGESVWVREEITLRGYCGLAGRAEIV